MHICNQRFTDPLSTADGLVAFRKATSTATGDLDLTFFAYPILPHRSEPHTIIQSKASRSARLLSKPLDVYSPSAGELTYMTRAYGQAMRRP